MVIKKQSPSINETSDKIMQRTQEIIAKEKLKPAKLLQDHEYKLKVKVNRPRNILLFLSIIVALITILFKIAVYYNILPKVKQNSPTAQHQIKSKATTSNVEKLPSPVFNEGK